MGHNRRLSTLDNITDLEIIGVPWLHIAAGVLILQEK